MADASPRFGFVALAECLNGRLAMLGFVTGLVTELLTGMTVYVLSRPSDLSPTPKR